ncbi:MAG: hypothetical protein KBI45_00575 [Candidatus Saccharicenans sp.]|jgi:hypothetical protein|nr:hypothetical protein [Candidatus Saccharicenans sp.]
MLGRIVVFLSLICIKSDISSEVSSLRIVEDCPDPDPALMCFNDSRCESIFREEYTNLFRQSYPDPWVIEVDVIPYCPYGICHDGMCRNYYDIWIRLFNPITGEGVELWNYHQPCETWPCN